MEFVVCHVSFSLIAFTPKPDLIVRSLAKSAEGLSPINLAHTEEIHKVIFGASIAHKLTGGEMVMSTE